MDIYSILYHASSHYSFKTPILSYWFLSYLLLKDDDVHMYQNYARDEVTELINLVSWVEQAQ